MELREYWRILRRRWAIPLWLTVAVALLSALQLQPWNERPPHYGASMRLLVGVMPAPDADVTAYDPRYYAWLTSEYLVDDFTEVVRSQLFARNVSERLESERLESERLESDGANAEGSAPTLPAGVIQGSAVTGRQHRILTLSLGWGDPAQLTQMAEAAATELVENAPVYFRQLGTDNAGVTLLDAPSVYVIGPSLRERLEWPMRIGLALFVGIGLIFLLEYLDSSVRRRRDLEELGLTILGEIPKNR
jgi:capsular polysaccharide biosynthesis protein